jgi:hypothetical protein
MTLRVRESGVFTPVGGGDSEWVRPADWPALPAVVATDQVFHGLHAVFDHGSNFATIRCTGAFTVDWGDGSAPVDVASNTTAQYNYSYAASGLGAVTSRGYKTAIVTVTPQAGQTLSNIDISQKHTETGLVNGHSSQWLDIRLAMNNVGTVTANNTNWPARLLERFEWVGGSSVQSNFQSFLANCPTLQQVPLFNTAAGTNFTNFLFGCSSLQQVPLFNTAAGTSFAGFLANCPTLQQVPLFNTAAGTSFANFLLGCVSISRIQATFPASQNISLASLALGPAALDEIYTNLPTASGTPRNITVTGNWGVSAGHDPTIATAKGWTVIAA